MGRSSPADRPLFGDEPEGHLRSSDRHRVGLLPRAVGDPNAPRRDPSPQHHLPPKFEPPKVALGLGPIRERRGSQKNFTTAGIILQWGFVLTRRPPELIDHAGWQWRSEEHTSELQSPVHLV